MRSGLREKTLVGFAIILAVGFALVFALRIPEASAATAGMGFSASALAQPGLPLALDSLAAENNIVTRDLTLTYRVSNTGTDHIRGIGLQIVFLDEERRAHGGTSVIDSVDLAPGQSARRELRLSNLHQFNPLTNHRTAVVAITEWRSEWAAWALDAPEAEVARALRGMARLAPAFSSVQSSENACDEGTWCNDCSKLAIGICGEGNIATFSCSVGSDSCSCSFTCKDAAPPEEPPQSRHPSGGPLGIELAEAHVMITGASRTSGCYAAAP